MTQAAKLAMEAQAKKEQLLQLVEKIQKDMKMQSQQEAAVKKVSEN